MARGISTRLSPGEGRRFGLVVGAAFLLLGGVFFWRSHPYGARVCWLIGGSLVVGGLAFPTRLGPVQALWMGLARAISKVTTPIIMTALYFVVFSPFGLVMRLFGWNSLKRRSTLDSFWMTRDVASRQRSDLERQF